MNLSNEVVETLLSRSTASILESHGFTSSDKSSLFALNRLAENYLQTVMQRSLAFAKTNKRSKVSYDDIELSFFMESISLGTLEEELLRLHKEKDTSTNLTTRTEKVARGFESVDKKIQAQLLGPELNGRVWGVPDYMEKGMILPNLPPLYTHHRSPVYVDRVEGDLTIREELTKESALVEKSLRRLLEVEEATSTDTATSTIDEDAIMAEERVTDVMISTMTAAEKQRRHRENIFNKVWQEMGYGTVPKSRAVNWMTARDASINSKKVAQV